MHFYPEYFLRANCTKIINYVLKLSVIIFVSRYGKTTDAFFWVCKDHWLKSRVFLFCSYSSMQNGNYRLTKLVSVIKLCYARNTSIYKTSCLFLLFSRNHQYLKMLIRAVLAEYKYPTSNILPVKCHLWSSLNYKQLAYL